MNENTEILDQPYLSVAQVCKRYGKSRSTIHKWVKEGRFTKVYSLGPPPAELRILVEAVNQFEKEYLRIISCAEKQ